MVSERESFAPAMRVKYVQQFLGWEEETSDVHSEEERLEVFSEEEDVFFVKRKGTARVDGRGGETKE
ncbi:hypothetical protein CEXT_143641 [Caerostris extrusa]|uniref:Uncharacterized protein n=1 Tax=Caerostris extrusa TaxID=172846 RepID=A0AAV4ULW6_CAEEX|nr:hypothetical protein CEXT_143641 [Caerostris extrusa]